ncbi:MAG: hypothetical protein U0Y10_25990 [Spirosomataceae bacterium]
MNNIDTLEQYLKYCLHFITLLTVITWWIAYQKRNIIRDTPVRWLLYMLFLLALWAVLEWLLIVVVLKKSFVFYNDIKPVLKSLGLKSMTLLNPLSYLSKFICLGYFFRDLMQKPLHKRFFIVSAWGLVVFEMVQVVVFKSYQDYDSLSSTVKNIFTIIGTSWFLYRFYQTDTGAVPLYRNPYFWISLGLLGPALAEIFMEFIFSKLQSTDVVLFYRLYLVRNFIQIVAFLLLITGFQYAHFLRFLKKEY